MIRRALEVATAVTAGMLSVISTVVVVLDVGPASWLRVAAALVLAAGSFAAGCLAARTRDTVLRDVAGYAGHRVDAAIDAAERSSQQVDIWRNTGRRLAERQRVPARVRRLP